jgi:transcriptional regulator with XRE-family HTH domain
MRYTDRFTATKIGTVLAEQGRRQDWLAEQVGVSGAALNRWIKGRRTIDRATAERIAAVLDVDLLLLIDVPKGSCHEPTRTEDAA